MTPEEKAKELYLRFHDYAHDTVSSKDENNPWYGETLAKKRIVHKNSTKQCALIAVDEILNIDNIKPYILHKEIIEYWENVKQEINKL